MLNTKQSKSQFHRLDVFALCYIAQILFLNPCFEKQ